MSLKRLFAQFLYIGATAFGGPLALIGLMEERLVERRKVVTSDQFAEGVALGQMLPGPVAVDAATYIGYCVRGFWGAIVATAGVVLPAFVLMLILTPLYVQYHTVPEAASFFRGARAAVVAVIVSVCWRMGAKALKATPAAAIAVLVFAVAVVCRCGPLAARLGPNVPVEAVLVLAAGALGIAFCRPRSQGSGRGASGPKGGGA